MHNTPHDDDEGDDAEVSLLRIGVNVMYMYRLHAYRVHMRCVHAADAHARNV